jgi:hypothetical protein
MLEKEDWIRRSSDFGDIVFNMWQKDQQTLFTETGGNKKRDEGTWHCNLVSIEGYFAILEALKLYYTLNNILVVPKKVSIHFLCEMLHKELIIMASERFVIDSNSLNIKRKKNNTIIDLI